MSASAVDRDPTAGTDFGDALAIFLRHTCALYDAGGVLPEAERGALRSSFRRLVWLAATADHTIEVGTAGLLADGAAVAPGARTTLGARMHAHGVRRIRVRRGASADDLLRLGRLLAGQPVVAAEPLALWHVEVSYAARSDSAQPAPLAPPARPGRAAAAPPRSELLAAITTEGDAERVLAQLVARTRRWATAGNRAGVSYALTELHRLAAEATAPAVRAACAHARTELSVQPVLRQFAELLPECDDAAEHLEVLREYGEHGATALIAQLLAAESERERHLFFDAIVALGAGRAALVDALGHVEGYVVRTAAVLLGALRETRALDALGRLLLHPDPGVRHAAAAALRRLESPVAHTGAELHDEIGAAASEEERVAVVRALGRLGTPAAVQRLTRMLIEPAATRLSTACRTAAAEALAHARGAAAVPLLRELAAEDNELGEPARRLVAALALA